MSRLCLVGGTGFIGRNLAERLVRQLHVLVIPTRRRSRTKRNLIMLPTVDLIDADIYDDATLAGLFAHCDAVINLVGVLHSGSGTSGSRYGSDFARAHVELPRKIAAACKIAGVTRLIHISALGAAEDAPSEYQRSKADGEAVVLASGLDATIFRPSVVFGPEDHFLNVFASLQKYLPVMLLASPQAKFQPVYVEDVAAAIEACLEADESFGKVYPLVGPRVYTLEQLVRYAGELSGHPRRVIGLGPHASMLFARLMELAPGQLMSRDNVRSMQTDNVSDAPFPFGIEPTPLEAVAPEYLKGVFPRSRYNTFRYHAGRHTSDEI